MTRNEFLEWARDELEQATRTYAHRVMNVVERAYAEGKRNAETDSIIGIVTDALKKAMVGGTKNER